MSDKIICKDCGKLYNEEDLEVVGDCEPEYEYIPTEVGTIPYFVGWVGGETDYHCADCGGELVKATECECCGKPKAINGNNWVCDDCKDEFIEKEPLKVAFVLGEYSYVDKPINGFIDYLFTQDEIDRILIDYAEEHKNDIVMEVLAKKYARRIENNRDLDFAILELKEEENGNGNGNS